MEGRAVSFDLENLRAKSYSLREAIAQLPKKELSQRISPVIGKDYNRLREMVLVAKPDLLPYVSPEVEVKKSPSGEFCEIDYVDLLAFTRTLYQLLTISDAPREVPSSWDLSRTSDSHHAHASMRAERPNVKSSASPATIAEVHAAHLLIRACRADASAAFADR